MLSHLLTQRLDQLWRLHQRTSSQDNSQLSRDAILLQRRNQMIDLSWQGVLDEPVNSRTGGADGLLVHVRLTSGVQPTTILPQLGVFVSSPSNEEHSVEVGRAACLVGEIGVEVRGTGVDGSLAGADDHGDDTGSEECGLETLGDTEVEAIVDEDADLSTFDGEGVFGVGGTDLGEVGSPLVVIGMDLLGGLERHVDGDERGELMVNEVQVLDNFLLNTLIIALAKLKAQSFHDMRLLNLRHRVPE